MVAIQEKKIISTGEELGYKMEYKILYAPDFGVPQIERVFFVGSKIGKFEFPKPTHHERVCVLRGGNWRPSGQPKTISVLKSQNIKKSQTQNIKKSCVKVQKSYLIMLEQFTKNMS